MTVAVRPDILSSLQSMREDVQRKVVGLDRYRALKAIEQTIADFPGLDDVTRSLSDIRDRVQEQLDVTREFRALRALERIMPELAEILALVEEGSAPEYGDGRAGTEPNTATGVMPTAAAPVVDVSAEAAGEAEILVCDIETTVCWVADEPKTPGPPPADGVEGAGGQPDVDTEQGAEAQHRVSKPDAMPQGPDGAAVPSLADSVAQLMAQSMSPQREAHAPPLTHPQERSDAGLPQAERAA